MKPQHFDILGALAFAYIVAFAVAMRSGAAMPDWAVVVLLCIGGLGLIVDLSIVFVYFIRKKR